MTGFYSSQALGRLASVSPSLERFPLVASRLPLSPDSLLSLSYGLPLSTLSCYAIWIQVPPAYFPLNTFIFMLYSSLATLPKFHDCSCQLETQAPSAKAPACSFSRD